MARNYASGVYQVQNPGKYVGSKAPRYRSSWEYSFMCYLDNHPDVVAWASEPIRIPYFNVFKKTNTVYVPDFLVRYSDKKGRMRTELIEIKPMSQTVMEKARGIQNKMQVALNKMKWSAAQNWCKKNGCVFVILTEEQLYKATNTYKPRKK